MHAHLRAWEKKLLSVVVVLRIFGITSVIFCAVEQCYQLLDPKIKLQRVRPYGLYVLHYLVSVVVILRIFGITTFSYCTESLHGRGCK